MKNHRPANGLANGGGLLLPTGEAAATVVAEVRVSLLSNGQVSIESDSLDPLDSLRLLDRAKLAILQMPIQLAKEGAAHGRTDSDNAARPD